MPFVRITHSAEIPPETVAALAQGATDLMEQLLGKKRPLTAVLVERTAPSGWTIGGAPVVVAAHLEANITAGTNSAAEKAAFISAAHALLQAQLGGLPEATYVIVREIAEGDWGYDGRTQAARRV